MVNVAEDQDIQFYLFVTRVLLDATPLPKHA